MTPVGYKGLVLGIPDLLSGILHFAVESCHCLNAAVNRALADAEVLARIEKLNAEPLPGSTPESVHALLHKDTERWQRLAREARLKIN
jgi:tripartite-type tricarboxylate transporter receptor subunit TctC